MEGSLVWIRNETQDSLNISRINRIELLSKLIQDLNTELTKLQSERTDLRKE